MASKWLEVVIIGVHLKMRTLAIFNNTKTDYQPLSNPAQARLSRRLMKVTLPILAPLKIRALNNRPLSSLFNPKTSMKRH